MRKVNRRVLEALIISGAMDDWGVERAVLFASIEKALQVGAHFTQKQTSGQQDLFSLFDDELVVEDYLPAKAWDIKKRLDGEKKTLGLYLTGHPADAYLQELHAFIRPIGQLNPAASKKATVCGLVTSVRRIVTKRGKKLAIIGLEDAHARVDIVTFSEIFDAKQDCAQVGLMLVVDGELGQDDYTGGVKMTATAMYSMEEARTRFAKHLALTLTEGDHAKMPAIQSVLAAHKGKCVVQIRYSNASSQAAMNLGAQWCVTPDDALLMKLADLLDASRVGLSYS